MDRKILWVGLISLLLIGAVGAGIFLTSKPDSFRGTAYTEPYPVAPEIDLVRIDGSDFRVQVLFVTVDPQRDTLQRQQEYVNHFNPSFLGLGGSEADCECRFHSVRLWQILSRI